MAKSSRTRPVEGVPKAADSTPAAEDSKSLAGIALIVRCGMRVSPLIPHPVIGPAAELVVRLGLSFCRDATRDAQLTRAIKYVSRQMLRFEGWAVEGSTLHRIEVGIIRRLANMVEGYHRGDWAEVEENSKAAVSDLVATLGSIAPADEHHLSFGMEADWARVDKGPWRRPFDASEAGPWGAVWKFGPPEWYEAPGLTALDRSGIVRVVEYADKNKPLEELVVPSLEGEAFPARERLGDLPVRIQELAESNLGDFLELVRFVSQLQARFEPGEAEPPERDLEAAEASFRRFAEARPQAAVMAAEALSQVAEEYRRFDERRNMNALQASEWSRLSRTRLARLGRDGIGELREGEWYYSGKELGDSLENRPRPGRKPKAADEAGAAASGGAAAGNDNAMRLEERLGRLVADSRHVDERRDLDARRASELTGLSRAMLSKLGRSGSLGELREGQWFFSGRELYDYLKRRPKPGPNTGSTQARG